MHLEDYVGFLNFSCVGQRWAKRSYKTAWTTGGLSNILVGYQVSFRVGKIVPFKNWWGNRFGGLTDGSMRDLFCTTIVNQHQLSTGVG